jgi:uncharacterized membrane protein YciS (DUF1049 family)
MGRIIGGVFLLLLVVAALALAVVNEDPITLNYYLGTVEIATSLALVIALTCGAVLGVSVSLLVVLRQKLENARLRHDLKLKEKELGNLRTIPVKDAR